MSLLVSRACVRRLCSAACGTSPAPPCPPCEPPVRPPCRRGRAPGAKLELHRVCCVPAPAHRPPCAPHVPPCSRTCDDAASQHHTQSGGYQASFDKKKFSSQKKYSTRQSGDKSSCSNHCPSSSEECGLEQNLVARRLAAAECARRRRYEASVQSPGLGVAPPLPPYVLPGPPPVAPDLRCSSDCKPPPARLIELQARPDGPCKPRPTATVDPCAHQPKVIYQIHRGAARVSDASQKIPPRSDPPQPRASGADETAGPGKTARALGSRIMQSLKGAAGATCPRKASCPTARPSCTAVVPPPAAPPCRPRNALRDQLKLRNDDKNKRCFHSSASDLSKSKDDKKGVGANIKKEEQQKKAVSKSCEHFKEVARGRDIVCSVGSVGGGIPPSRARSDSLIELPVPPNARTIRINVSVLSSNSKVDPKFTQKPTSPANCPAPPIKCPSAATKPPTTIIMSSKIAVSTYLDAAKPPKAAAKCPLATVKPCTSAAKPPAAAAKSPKAAVQPCISATKPPTSSVKPPTVAANPCKNEAKPLAANNVLKTAVKPCCSSTKPSTSSVKYPTVVGKPCKDAAKPSTAAVISTIADLKPCVGPNKPTSSSVKSPTVAAKPCTKAAKPPTLSVKSPKAAVQPCIAAIKPPPVAAMPCTAKNESPTVAAKPGGRSSEAIPRETESWLSINKLRRIASGSSSPHPAAACPRPAAPTPRSSSAPAPRASGDSPPPTISIPDRCRTSCPPAYAVCGKSKPKPNLPKEPPKKKSPC